MLAISEARKKPMFEVWNLKSEVRSPKSEVRSLKSEAYNKDPYRKATYVGSFILPRVTLLIILKTREHLDLYAW
jgi:hypothetical protein